MGEKRCGRIFFIFLLFSSFLTSEIENAFGVYSDVHIPANVSVNFHTCIALRLKHGTV